MQSKLIFLEYKTGTSKSTGKPYEILELSKDHRNFSVDLSPELDRSILSTFKYGDYVNVELSLNADYNGRGRSVVTSIKKAS